MLKISTIPDNTTLGEYEVYIIGYSSSDAEGGQISDKFTVVNMEYDPKRKIPAYPEKIQCSSFKEGIELLVKREIGNYYYPNYHDLYVRISFNGNNILEEYRELVKETAKAKEQLSEKEYNEWCVFMFEETQRKDFLFDTIDSISREILG